MSIDGLRMRKMARTHEQIADAAMTAFMERGYDPTTLDEIADAVEVHKRTLLRYFPTKAHLVLHVYYAALEEFRAELAARGETSVIDVWEAHVIEHARIIVRRGSWANTHKLATTEPAVRQAYSDIQSDYLTLVADALSVEAGLDPDTDIRSKVIAAALIAGNFAVGRMVRVRGVYTELEQAEREVIRLVREGLVPAGKPKAQPRRARSVPA